jgi:hypothetical protein
MAAMTGAASGRAGADGQHVQPAHQQALALDFAEPERRALLGASTSAFSLDRAELLSVIRSQGGRAAAGLRARLQSAERAAAGVWAESGLAGDVAPEDRHILESCMRAISAIVRRLVSSILRARRRQPSQGARRGADGAHHHRRPPDPAKGRLTPPPRPPPERLVRRDTGRPHS